jgi:hypothetical protein
MPPEDAMQKYIDIVTELFPSWASGGADVRLYLLYANTNPSPPPKKNN